MGQSGGETWGVLVAGVAGVGDGEGELDVAGVLGGDSGGNGGRGRCARSSGERRHISGRLTALALAHGTHLYARILMFRLVSVGDDKAYNGDGRGSGLGVGVDGDGLGLLGRRREWEARLSFFDVLSIPRKLRPDSERDRN